jgi:tRNA U34 5-methylaminomethyl-2-thiouridine-forming methyltransferase MnmC
LEEEIWSNLNYATNEFEKEIFQKIHQLPWEEKGAVDAQMSLTKLKMDLADVSSKGAFDIIYYDAFGPDKQPHLWTPKIFNILFEILDMGGIFVTYSAKGQVRRDLVSAGFEIERIPGPPGKREMLRGRKK